VLLGLLLSDSGSTILRNEKRSCVRKCVALRALFTLAKLLHCALLFVTGRKGRFFQKMERAEIELLVEQEMNRRDELEEIRREQRAGVKPESKSRGVGVREFDSIRSGRRFESNPDLGRFERLGDTTRVNWSNESGPGPDFARDTFGRAHYPEGESSRVVEIEAGTRLGTSEETINLLPKAVTTIVSTATTTVATFIIKTAAYTTKATDQRDGGPYLTVTTVTTKADADDTVTTVGLRWPLVQDFFHPNGEDDCPWKKKGLSSDVSKVKTRKAVADLEGERMANGMIE